MEGDEFGDGELEGFDALASDGGDGVKGKLAAFGHGGELFELVGVGYVGLGGYEDGRFGGESGVEGFELFGDDFEVLNGVRAGGAFGGTGVGDVYEVDDDAGALDVAKELDAEPVAEVRAFDEAGEIGHGEGFGVGEFADLDDAEVGLKGGEGVVGDLGFGGGEAGDEGGLADVGVADEAGVGEETELEAVVALFAGAAEFMFPRSLMRAGGEVLVAASSASAAGDDDGVAGLGEVVDELAGVVVVEEGCRWGPGG